MKQRGIALVQVLLIVAVVSILALYFTQSARQQVKNATMMVDKAQALVELNNAEASILFSLLTEKPNRATFVPIGFKNSNMKNLIIVIHILLAVSFVG